MHFVSLTYSRSLSSLFVICHVFVVVSINLSLPFLKKNLLSSICAACSSENLSLLFSERFFLTRLKHISFLFWFFSHFLPKPLVFCL